jgi:lysophospholipid acyltransferase (LPLAT)-like uncharacterized protein
MIRSKMLSFIAWVLISFWSRSIKVRFVNKGIPEGLAAEGKNIIYAFWHGGIFLLFHTHRNSGILIPASESRDGEIMAGLLKRFGFDVVRGSSRRKGHKALLGLIGGMRSGKTVGMAVDGPRGPLHEVKEGAVFLAAKLNSPIIPVATAAKRYRVLGKTWDKLVIPAPFTEGLVLYGDPIFVHGASYEEITSKRNELQTVLRRLTHEASDMATAPKRVVSRRRHWPSIRTSWAWARRCRQATIRLLRGAICFSPHLPTTLRIWCKGCRMLPHD